MKTILIAPNSFKECADSIEVASLIEKNLPSQKFNLIKKPVSDGGDGFLNICKENFNLEEFSSEISTPFDESKIKCPFGYNRINKTIYIESADILGLKIIPQEKRKPAILNSKGLGELLLFLNNNPDLKIKKVTIGIGGTGTNDLAIGVLSILGLKLLDENKNEIDPFPQNFIKVKDVIWNEPKLTFDFELIVDVDNPLTGENGATETFGKQKGLLEKEIESIENGFINLINIFKEKGILKNKNLNGAGGGLAAGLQIFLNAEIKKSEEFILKDLEIGILKNEVDIIITGEGSFDNQSYMKKATGVIIDLFKNSGKQIFLICGKFEDNLELSRNLKVIQLVDFYDSVEESKNNFEGGIKSALAEINKICF